MAFFYLNRCNRDKQKEKDSIALVNALNDSLRYYINKDSENVATISVISTESTKAFTDLKVSNEEIRKLQETVKDYSKKLKAGSSVTRASIETAITSTNPTNVLGDIKIEWKNDTAYVYPTYKDSIENKWISYKAVMNKDTSKVSIKITNDFSAIVGYTKNKVPFVDLVTENPYTVTKTLRTYQVKMPRVKKLGIGPNASYGFGSDFKQKVFLGVGLQYNLIRL